MSYTPIDDLEINPGKPGKSSVFYRLRDNVLAIAAGLAGAPKIQWAALATVPGQNLYAWTAGGTFSFVVPAGVDSIEAEGWGAGSSNGYTDGSGFYNGVGGEFRLGRIAVVPSETLTIVVGAGVAPPFAGGANVSPLAGGPSQIRRGATVLMQFSGGYSSTGVGGVLSLPAYGTMSARSSIPGPGAGGMNAGMLVPGTSGAVLVRF